VEFDISIVILFLTKLEIMDVCQKLAMLLICTPR